MTRYELVKVVSLRVEQLSTGCRPTIRVDNSDSPLDIAIKELEEGRLPMMLDRFLPDGTRESVHLSTLLPPKRALQHLKSISVLPNDLDQKL